MEDADTSAGKSGLSRLIDWLAATDSAFGVLTTVMNIIGTVWIVVMSALVVADVVSLNFFNYGIPAVKEFFQLSLPGIVFLQLTNTLRENRHVSSDILMTPLQRRFPQVSAFIYAIFNLIGAGLMCMVGWVMIPKAEQAYDEGFFRGLDGVLTLPEWPSMALVVIGSFAMAFQYLLFFLRDLAVTIRGGATSRDSSLGSEVEQRRSATE